MTRVLGYFKESRVENSLCIREKKCWQNTQIKKNIQVKNAFWWKINNNNEGEAMVPLKLMRKVNPKW